MSQQEITTELNPYEKLYGRRLSFNEVAEMKSNLVGFFVELIKADRENRLESESND